MAQKKTKHTGSAPKIEAVPSPTLVANITTITVKMKTAMCGPNINAKIGETVELDPKFATDLIDGGYADLISVKQDYKSYEAPETTELTPIMETRDE